MRTLLIVEDEKLIRQGIAVMARRSGVRIGEIIECRNGLEALEVLKSREIDAMFTDIRMPKMDGIELVKETKNLKKCPKTIVVSGYDDFSYAVEMLKHGVKDYILKPIKREKVEELLQKLEEEINAEKKAEDLELQAFSRELRRYLQNPSVPEKELESVRWNFERYMGQTPYRAVVGVKEAGGQGEGRGLYPEIGAQGEGRGLYPEVVGQGEGLSLRLEENGQDVWFVKEEQLEAITQDAWQGIYAGISRRYNSFSGCAEAYREAEKARIHAYFHRQDLCYYEKLLEKQAEGEIPADFVSHFVSQFPTGHLEKAVGSYRQLLFAARHGGVCESDCIETARQLEGGLRESYQKLVSEENGPFFDRKPPLSFATVDEYEQDFVRWIKQVRECLDEEYDSNQNRNKIRTAVRYIEENYKSDLNMAMVSNYVSMNYSLFSIAFKEYTGVNFVGYLKNLRIEEAKRLLETTDEKVQDIGRKVGFESDKHFLKSFKSICGISPTDYRKNAGLGK